MDAWTKNKNNSTQIRTKNTATILMWAENLNLNQNTTVKI